MRSSEYKLYAHGNTFTRKETFNTKERLKIALDDLEYDDDINSAEARDPHGELIYSASRTGDGWIIHDHSEDLKVATADIEIDLAHARGEI